MLGLMSSIGRPTSAGRTFRMLARLGREAADAALAVEDDDRDVDGAEQVDEVAVDLGDLVVAAVQLVVDGGQLLVGRLELLLGGLELLVHALELFVAGDELLVGRAELVVGPAVLLDERLEVLLGRRELVLELGEPPVARRAQSTRGAACGRRRWRRRRPARASSNSTTKSGSLTSGQAGERESPRGRTSA